jgi:hypothetical protein
VDRERLDELLADREDGVQAGHRLLKDHPDLLAADRAHLVPGQVEQVAALEKDPAAVDEPGRLRDELQE